MLFLLYDVAKRFPATYNKAPFLCIKVSRKFPVVLNTFCVIVTKMSNSRHFLSTSTSCKHVLMKTLIFSIISMLIPNVIACCNCKLIFEDNFDTLNRSTWQHLITSWRGGQSQFQYYTNRTENRYVSY